MTIYAHQKSKKRKAYSKERRSIDAMTRELRMKYNINVIKSVWHRLRKTKASHARRDPLERRNLHRSVLSNGGFSARGGNTSSIQRISPNDRYRGRSNHPYKRLGSPREWLPRQKLDSSKTINENKK